MEWKGRDVWLSMVTHTQNFCSAFNHPHTVVRREHTHTVNTHLEQYETIALKIIVFVVNRKDT